MFKNILSVLYIALFIAVYLTGSFDVYGNDEEYEEEFNMMEAETNIREGWASSPVCAMTTRDIAKIVKSLTSATSAFYAGYSLYKAGKKSPEPISKRTLMTQGLFIMSQAALAVFTAIMSTPVFVCIFTFMRNPVQHYSPFLSPTHPDYQYRGQMKKRLSPVNVLLPKYAPTDKYYEAESAPYSDYWAIGSRFPNPLTLGFGAGCERGHHAWSTDGDAYRGENSRLCPEEWQASGIDFVLEELPGGYVRQRVKRDSNGNYVYFNTDRKDSGTEWVKWNSAPTKFSGPSRGSAYTYIHGYKFKVDDGGPNGTIVCAYMIGFGEVPIDRLLPVGCHYRYKQEAYPQCKYSKPIHEDGTWDPDTNTIIPGTGTGKILDYDNTECYGCVVSGACIGNGDMRPHKAMLPFTSIAYRCIKESFVRFTQGCIASDGTVIAKSNIASIQERIWKIVHVIIGLGVGLLSVNIMIGSIQANVKEIMMASLKIAAVFYLTTTNDAGVGGLQTVMGFMDSIKDGLVAQVSYSFGHSSGLCAYNRDDYILDYHGETTDYEYLMLWDMLDCYVSYMIGFVLLPERVLQTIADDEVAELGVPYVFTFFIIIIASILGGPFMPLLLVAMVIFGVILFIFVIWAVQTVIMCMVIFQVLGFIMSMIAPALLFNSWKPLFDGVMREAIGYESTELVLSIFLIFVTSAIHPLFFGNTQFFPRDAYVIGKKATVFFVKGDGGCATSSHTEVVQGEVPCGCDRGSIACFFSGMAFVTRPIIFNIMVTGIEIVDETQDPDSVALNILILALLLFLFLHFFQILNSMMLDLFGTRGYGEISGAAIDPRDAIKSVGAKGLSGMSKWLASGDQTANKGKKDKKDQKGKGKSDGGGGQGESRKREGVGSGDSITAEKDDKNDKKSRDFISADEGPGPGGGNSGGAS